MPHIVRASLLLIALLFACPQAGSTVQADDPAPSLAFDGSGLSLEGAALAVTDAAAAPVPYRIFSRTPLVLTMLLDGLEPATLMLRADPLARGGLLTALYRGHLPQPLHAGGVALISVPDSLTGVSSGLSLFDAAGEEYWRVSDGSQAQLLPAALDNPAGTAAAPLLVLRWQGDNPIFPYGNEPELLKISIEGEDTVEEALRLDLPSPAAGVELLAGSATRGLLLVQYDYQAYEFIALSYAPLGITARWSLSGQPLTELVYPGPGYAYTALEMEADTVSLAVFEGGIQGAVELWSFNLASGELAASAYLDELRDAVDAANAADAQPGAVPYPQVILPSQDRPSWSIPALLDHAGRALVIRADGAVEWLNPSL